MDHTQIADNNNTHSEEKMPFLTIFTPTYNRKHTLKRLYESLTIQAFKDFEWLIVDDGSTDDTEQEVKLWSQEGKVSIMYFQKDNGGKHVAYNYGLELARGKYFFCVDSDDWLPSSALQVLYSSLQKIQKTDAIGVVGLKQLENGKQLSPSFPNGLKSTLFDISQRYGIHGEFSIVYETEMARGYKFPEIIGEMFATEAIVYDAMSKDNLQFILTNQLYTICEYQENGLSGRNPYRVMVENPGGFKVYYGNRIDMSLNFLERLKNILRYWAFSLMFRNQKHTYQGRYYVLVRLLFPLGFFAWLYYKTKVV